MQELNELFFEIQDTDDFVRLEPLELMYNDSDIDWDKNFIKTKVSLKGGAFSGYYIAEIMTVDFLKLKKEFTLLNSNLNYSFHFNDLENYIVLELIGDGKGNIEVEAIACDYPCANPTELTIQMSIDQTALPKLIEQLDLITKRFPITGDCWTNI